MKIYMINVPERKILQWTFLVCFNQNTSAQLFQWSTVASLIYKQEGQDGPRSLTWVQWPHVTHNCEAKRNHLGNCSRGSLNNNSCKVLSKLVKRLWRRCRLKVFFYFYPWRTFCTAEQNHLGNFGRLEGHPTTIPVKFYQNPTSDYGGDVI